MKCLFTLLIAMLVTGIAYNQPGTLDKSFGNKGFVSANNLGYHFAIAQQYDGKLLTAGGYDEAGSLVGRFLQDGTIDSLFGNKGFAAFEIHSSEAYDIVLHPDDKLIVIGSFIDNNEAEFSFVARFATNGTLDSSFGANGMTVIPDFGDRSSYQKIALETDGSIIISGSGSAIGSQSTLPQYSLLCHLSDDGTFDYSFGNGGRALVSGNAVIQIHKTGLAIQKDGKILQAGYNYIGATGQKDYVLSRYLSNGSLDSGFGTNGTVTTAGVEGLIAADFPCGIVVQPDGKIVMGGTSPGYNYITYMAALRYNTDGSLDATFGKGGRALTSFPGYTPTATAILLQPDGKLILTGAAAQISVQSGFALCRLDTDGSVDSSFGIDGREIAYYSGSVDVTGYCAALQSDGKIVIGGSYYDNERGYESYLLARFNGDESKRQIIATRIKRWLQHHGITWQMDNSVRYCNVQRSNDGGVTYQPVAKIYNNHQTQYNYEDAAGKSNDLYRVAAVGKDGSRSYSNSVLLSNESSVSVFPNPVRSTMQLQGLSTESKTNISIVDFTGNVRTTATASGSTCSVNTSNLQPGNYFIKIESNKTVTTQPFVKE